MPAVRERISQDDFAAGLDRGVAPQLIPENGVFDLLNGLLDEDGNPYRRGGTTYLSSEGFGESGLTWVWDGYLHPGRRTLFANASGFGVLDASNDPVNLGGNGLSAPRQAAVQDQFLYIGGGTIYGGSRKASPYSSGLVTVTNGSTTVTGSGTAWLSNVDPGMLFQIGNERLFIVEEVESDTVLKLTEAYTGTTGGSKTYALRPLYTVSTPDPYVAWDFVATCANRLVLGSGRRIIFTEVNDPHTFTNSLGTTNEHKLPGGTEIVGLHTVGQTDLIFTTMGVWALDGLALSIVDLTGNPQHRLVQVSSEIILAGASGLAGSEQQVVVPATDGIYLMDGVSRPERISRPVDRLYQRRIGAGYEPGGAAVYHGHYFLPILRAGNEVTDMFVCRLDRDIRSRSQTTFPWTRVDGDGGEIRCFAVRSGLEEREPELLGAQAREPSRVLNCSTYFSPEAAYAKDADGSVHMFALITRDIETGAETENIIRALRLRYELELVAAGEGVVEIAWGDGSLASGGDSWGEVEWDAFDWAVDESGATFNAAAQSGEPSNGREVRKFRVNDRQRFGRFRVATIGAVSRFALRSIAMDIRPSGAVRR